MTRFLSFAILVVVLLAAQQTHAQHFIGKTYKEVNKKLKKYKTGIPNTSVQVTDSAGTLHLAVRGDINSSADFIYAFDENGKCKSEKLIAYCDSCYKKYLNEALAQKKFGWKKINANQYASSFEQKMMMELPVIEETSRFYIILRTNWIKETYDMLVPVK